MKLHFPRLALLAATWCCVWTGPLWSDDPIAVRAKKVITAAGQTITDGMVLCSQGKITAVGKASEMSLPGNAKVLECEVLLPGLIDVRTCVGLSGILNSKHDSDQLEASSAMQPELRAIDAYNPREELVEYIRGFGVTTVQTGHAPGELISGQTLIAKTTGNTIEQALLTDGKAVVVTLSEASQKSGKQSPGTRGKQMAMLRTLLIEAQEFERKTKPKETSAKTTEDSATSSSGETPARNLRLEAMVDVLHGKKKLLVTADKAQDIASALRLASEFKIAIWLDSASDAHLMLPQIKSSGVEVLLHPTMARASGDKENLSFQTASKLKEAGIPFAIQGGYEPYVPKVRVVLFEAGMAYAHGLKYEHAIESITIAPAKILGIDHRVGSIEIGKDADLALYDGDPLEYTSHCTGVIIDGKVVSDAPH
jgi:imidazolonepropionase-like amidohydrolase